MSFDTQLNLIYDDHSQSDRAQRACGVCVPGTTKNNIRNSLSPISTKGSRSKDRIPLIWNISSYLSRNSLFNFLSRKSTREITREVINNAHLCKCTFIFKKKNVFLFSKVKVAINILSVLFASNNTRTYSGT